jgi:hypothetical protein
MRVLALEPFDERGQLRRDGAGLAAVLARFGSERFEAAAAVAHGPVQQRIDGDRCASGEGDLVMAGGDVVSAPGEFAAGQRFEHQRRNQTVAEERELFGFGIHAEPPCPRK